MLNKARFKVGDVIVRRFGSLIQISQVSVIDYKNELYLLAILHLSSGLLGHRWLGFKSEDEQCSFKIEEDSPMWILYV